eukprot:3339404-Rhodomonas_salina.2
MKCISRRHRRDFPYPGLLQHRPPRRCRSEWQQRDAMRPLRFQFRHHLRCHRRWWEHPCTLVVLRATLPTCRPPPARRVARIHSFRPHTRLPAPKPRQPCVVRIRKPIHRELHPVPCRHFLGLLPKRLTHPDIVFVHSCVSGQLIRAVRNHLVTWYPCRHQMHAPLRAEHPDLHCEPVQHLAVLRPAPHRACHRHAIREM